jgi:UDP-galactose-lipid carrier transferase
MNHGNIPPALDPRSRADARSSHLGAVLCGIAMAVSDVLSIALAGQMFGVLGIWPVSGFFERIDYACVAAFIADALAVSRFVTLQHYVKRMPALRELRELLGVLALACVCHIALLALHGNAVDVFRTALAWGCVAVLLPAARLVVKLLLIKLHLWQRDLYVIGSGRLALDAAAAIKREPLMGLALRAFVPVGECQLPQDAPLAPLRPLDASSLAGSVIMIALGPEHAALRNTWLRALGAASASSIVVVADVPGVPLHGIETTYVNSHELLLLRVRNNLSRWHVRMFKRCLDLGGALSISLMLSPLLLFIAWQVRKDGGNAIYGHPRIGRHARPFNCYKFRSMVVNASAVLAELLERHPEARREWERDFKLKDDPRVTRIGAFLRRTSLDELPQLWNVIRGDMSLVGPRPIVEAELARYADDVSYYLMARPGMTGLWQVSGRNDADYPTRVYLDAWYVRNWSLWYDIAILFKTVRTVCKRDGAY